MIKLHRLAVTTLSLDYSRELLSDGPKRKLRHYKVPMSWPLLKGQTADALVRDYIAKTDGVSTSDIIIDSPPIVVETAQGLVQGPAIITKECPEILVGLPKVKKQLERHKCDTLIYQYVGTLPSLKDRLYNVFSEFVNRVTSLINRPLAAIQRLFLRIKPSGDDIWFCDRRIKFIPAMKLIPRPHHIVPCRFLAVAFEQSDTEKAIEIMRTDLSKLADQDLILGHLAMPSIIELADTIGSGQKTYALFCFLFVDEGKLLKSNGLTYLDLKPNELMLRKLLGLRTESYEGSLTVIAELDHHQKYDIEVVSIGQEERESRHEAYIESYHKQREAIDAADQLNKERDLNNEIAYKQKIKEENEEKQKNLDTLLIAAKYINADAPTLVSDKQDDYQSSFPSVQQLTLAEMHGVLAAAEALLTGPGVSVISKESFDALKAILLENNKKDDKSE